MVKNYRKMQAPITHYNILRVKLCQNYINIQETKKQKLMQINSKLD